MASPTPCAQLRRSARQRSGFMRIAMRIKWTSRRPIVLTRNKQCQECLTCSPLVTFFVWHMQSWDVFEQMQRPQQPPSQPSAHPTHMSQPIIEPGSQPLPAGMPMQPMQALGGLPPRGRGERRLSGATPADGPPPLRRDSGSAADAQPQQPASVQVPTSAVRPVVVSGVSDELLNRWFAEADEDLDGRQALSSICSHLHSPQN